MKNKLIQYIKKTNIEIENHKASIVYDHMGAIIVDSILQAGLNYQTVVLPRVKLLIEKYASFTSCISFNMLIDIFGVDEIINFKNKRKNMLIKEVTIFLINNKVNDVFDFSKFLKNQKNITNLLAIKGIGNKTIDYMKKLVGVDTMPIDRHMINFLNMAGVSVKGYHEIQEIYIQTAKELNINLTSLDKTIWNYMSN